MVRTPKFVLASGSPRRRELLQGLDVGFRVRPADLDESVLPGESPDEHVQRLAREKAAAEAAEDELILAADTVVVIDGDILGKPDDADEARRMLSRLAGQRHTVFTGVAMLDGASRRRVQGLARTDVRIAAMTPAEVDWYVTTGEPLDKAGAYAIQGLGALFVEAIDGNYTNVVGLPIPLVKELFQRLEFDLRDFRAGLGS
jgi:septum formation protein